MTAAHSSAQHAIHSAHVITLHSTIITEGRSGKCIKLPCVFLFERLLYGVTTGHLTCPGFQGFPCHSLLLTQMHHNQPPCTYVPFLLEELLGQRICISVISRDVTELPSMAVPAPGPATGRKWIRGLLTPHNQGAPTPAHFTKQTLKVTTQTHQAGRARLEPAGSPQPRRKPRVHGRGESSGSWGGMSMRRSCSSEHTRPSRDTPWSPRHLKGGREVTSVPNFSSHQGLPWPPSRICTLAEVHLLWPLLREEGEALLAGASGWPHCTGCSADRPTSCWAPPPQSPAFTSEER